MAKEKTVKAGSNAIPAVPGPERLRQMNISVGNLTAGKEPSINPYGTGQMRGYGAATKGRKTSGKMG